MNEFEFIELYTNIIKQKKIPTVNVDATHGEIFVPREYIHEDGTIQLSLSPTAIRDLKVTNDTVYCRASFKRQIFSISFPLANIIDMSIEDENDHL
jgi:stringent starvation protein B